MENAKLMPNLIIVKKYQELDGLVEKDVWSLDQTRPAM